MPRPDNYQSLARWYGMAVPRMLQSAHRRLADLCAEQGFSRLVDIGCGVGSFAAVAAGRLAGEPSARGMSVTGIDASFTMLSQAAQKPWGPDPPLFAQGGIPLPFPSRSFDAAIFSLVLHEADEEPEALLAEGLRVAPVCLVLEWRMPERNLDLPGHVLAHAIERCAGKRHYARFREFVRGGGLHGAARRADARVVHEEALMGGTMVLAEVTAR